MYNKHSASSTQLSRILKQDNADKSNFNPRLSSTHVPFPLSAVINMRELEMKSIDLILN